MQQQHKQMCCEDIVNGKKSECAIDTCFWYLLPETAKNVKVSRW